MSKVFTADYGNLELRFIAHTASKNYVVAWRDEIKRHWPHRKVRWRRSLIRSMVSLLRFEQKWAG